MNNGDCPASPIFNEHGFVGNWDVLKDPSNATGGLTKREAFAMAAMQGAMSTIDDGHVSYDVLASDAVEMANALLKALEIYNAD